MKMKMKFLTALCLTFSAGGLAFGGDSGKEIVDTLVEADQASICDIFDMVTLYEDEGNPFMQKFALTGRLQADAAFFYGGDEDYEQLVWRRFRFGFKSQIFENFTLHSEGDFELNDRDPLYERLTDTYLAWSQGDEFQLKIGKQSAGFTMDGATSSKKILRPERSLLSENLWFPTEYHSGVSANGEIDKWIYNIGMFSSAGGAEFGDFDAGWFGLISLGYDFGEAWGLDKALIRADYVNNDPDEGNTGTRDLAQVGSLNGHFKAGPWGLRTDVAAADGYGDQSDLFGVFVMPYYDITDKLQLVASYNYVRSASDNGVRPDRYEKRTVDGNANAAHEFFAGVNYFICGHKLKWQNGVEYTKMIDDANDGGAYNGWGVTSAIRISW